MQQYIPDSNERATLKMAGLSEETVILDLLGEAYEINKFPKLKGGGSYELLRVPESGSKVLWWNVYYDPLLRKRLCKHSLKGGKIYNGAFLSYLSIYSLTLQGCWKTTN